MPILGSWTGQRDPADEQVLERASHGAAVAFAVVVAEVDHSALRVLVQVQSAPPARPSPATTSSSHAAAANEKPSEYS
jgi:hypothetical protein